MKWTVLGIFIFVLAIERGAAKGFDLDHPEFFKRIIGGGQSKANQFPWLTNLLRLEKDNTYKHRCGGALIDAEWVLTAAHCLVFSPNAKYKIRLGEHDQNVNSGVETDHNVVYYQFHDRFMAEAEYAYDIALVKIAPAAKFSAHVKPIGLPRLYEQVPVGSKCVVAGWGKTGSSRATVLRHVELPIVSYKTCAAENDKLPYTDVSLFSNICAGNASTVHSGCNGDSGGPFMCKNASGQYVLQGIVSWGSPSCSSNFYSVFTRVSSFIKWIGYMKAAPRPDIGTDCKKDYHYFCKEWKDKGWCSMTFIQTFCQKTCVGCSMPV